MRNFWRLIKCLLFHPWKYGEWKPIDWADDVRFVECPTCKTQWLEYR